MKLIEAQETQESGIDVAPMIDILFMLIIFFLATTTFQAQEREEQVQLPRHGGSSLSSKERSFIINVIRSAKKPYIVRGKTVGLVELQGLLRETYADNPERRVLIRGDKEALHGTTTAALAACTEAHFPNASIVWDTSTPKK